jgi:hypothetical protein
LNAVTSNPSRKVAPACSRSVTNAPATVRYSTIAVLGSAARLDFAEFVRREPTEPDDSVRCRATLELEQAGLFELVPGHNGLSVSRPRSEQYSFIRPSPRHAHGLRHLFATELQAEGARTLSMIRDLPGHSFLATIDTTFAVWVPETVDFARHRNWEPEDRGSSISSGRVPITVSWSFVDKRAGSYASSLNVASECPGRLLRSGIAIRPE